MNRRHFRSWLLRSLLPLAICGLSVISPLATFAQIGGAGWTSVTPNFKIQWPYNVPENTRYWFTNGIYHCLVFSNDAPFSSNSTTLPRTEQRFLPDYTSGEIQYQATIMAVSNENSYCVFQIHTGDAQSAAYGSTTFMLFWFTSNGGSVHDYSGTELANNLANQWFQLNVDHNLVTRTIKVWINQKLVWTQQDNGAGDFYFKDGVYEQSHGPTLQMDTYITNILMWVSSGTNSGSNPGTLLWTGGGADDNWSTPFNWTNLTVAGNNPPDLSNSLLFTNSGAAVASALTAPGSGVLLPANLNSIVDRSFAVAALTNYANGTGASPVYQNLGFAAGATVSVGGNLQIGGYGQYDFGANNLVNMSISGSQASLMLTNGALVVSQGSGSAGAHTATLDLSALDTFLMNGTQIKLGVENITRAGGILYLAKTNVLTLTSAGYVNSDGSGSPYSGNPALYLGHNKSAFGNGAQLYLGISNSIAADYVTVGRGDANDLLALNPAFIGSNPATFIRGTNGDSSRVGVYVIGDGSAGQAASFVATNDFTGGSVNAMLNYLCVGRGRQGASDTSSNAGMLTFNAGTINANTLVVGFLYPNGSNSVVAGTVNVNGGTLTVLSNLTLAARPAVGGTGTAQGTLNINGGVVQTANIIAGGGVSTLALNSGTLLLTNTAGAPGAALSTLNLANSTLRLHLDGAAITTNIVVTNLTAGGLNILTFDAVANVTGITYFPLLAYNSFNGPVAANFTRGALPASYSATLIDNAAQKRIDLVIAPSATVSPRFAAATFSGGNLVFTGSNGLPGSAYCLLSSSSLTLPSSQWTSMLTNQFDSNGNFILTLSPAPAAPCQFFRLLVAD